MTTSLQNIFDPVQITLVNGNFQQGTAIPPLGWMLGCPFGQIGLPGLVSYDTSTQYQGTQSVEILTTTSAAAGISSTAFPISVTPNQLVTISSALKMLTAGSIALEMLFFDSSGDFISALSVSVSTSAIATGWEYLTTSGLVPAGAAQAVLGVAVTASGGGEGEVAAVSCGISNAPQYYLSLVTSEYRSAPNFNSWLTALLTPLMQSGLCAATMYYAFDLINGAVGPQLDVLGQIIGASRIVQPFSVSGAISSFTVATAGTGYVLGDTVTVVQGGASGGQLKLTTIFHGVQFWSIVAGGTNYTTASGLSVTGGTGSGLTVNINAGVQFGGILDDNDYRSLLLATVVRNNWNGQQDSLYAFWNQLFPSFKIYIQDNFDMTATIFVVGNLTSQFQALIQGGFIVPRPQGVQYNYVFNLPAFGCDLDNTFVAGVDVGLMT